MVAATFMKTSNDVWLCGRNTIREAKASRQRGMIHKLDHDTFGEYRADDRIRACLPSCGSVCSEISAVFVRTPTVLRFSSFR